MKYILETDGNIATETIEVLGNTFKVVHERTCAGSRRVTEKGFYEQAEEVLSPSKLEDFETLLDSLDFVSLDFMQFVERWGD